MPALSSMLSNEGLACLLARLFCLILSGSVNTERLALVYGTTWTTFMVAGPAELGLPSCTAM